MHAEALGRIVRPAVSGTLVGDAQPVDVDAFHGFLVS
jgi:hypothetical protein